MESVILTYAYVAVLLIGKIDFIEWIIQMDYSAEESCIATQFRGGENPLFWAMRYPKIVKSIIEIFKKKF